MTKVTVDRKTLKTALGWAKAVAGLGMYACGGTTNIRLALHGFEGGQTWSGRLEISARGLGGEIRICVPCKAQGHRWERLVEVGSLLRAVKKFKGEKLVVSGESGSEGYGKVGLGLPRRSTAMTVVGPDLPGMEPDFSESLAFEPSALAVHAGPLATVLRKVTPAICKDEFRGNLAMVELEIERDLIRAITTDGHRIHVATEAIGYLPEGWPNSMTVGTPWALLTDSVFRYAKRVGTDDGEALQMGIVAKCLGFNLEMVDGVTVDMVVPRASHGNLPDWRRHVTKHTTQVVVNRAPLVATLWAIRKAEGRDAAVVLGAKKGSLSLTSEQSDKPAHLDCWQKGRPSLAKFYVGYLLDYLKEMKDPTVSLQFNGKLDPVRMDGGEDESDSYWALVMPLRL